MTYGTVPFWAHMFASLIWAACDVGMGRKYGHTGDATQDCIRFLFGTMSTYRPDIDFAASMAVLHLNFDGALGGFGHLEKYVELGAAEDITDYGPPPGEACICQVWYRNSRGELRGHTLILISAPMGASGDTLWQLDFTTATADGFRPIVWTAFERKYSEIRLVRIVRPG